MEILGHFMEEDIRLYWYLKDFYKNEKSVLSIVNTFESSIKEIQKDVMYFLEFYAKEEAKLDTEFVQKFEDIVKKLDARLQSEETSLYSLYNR
jgi:predicted secreted protein